MDNYSAFIQDDWRLGGNFVLNLGLRYDYYGVVKVRPTTPVEVEIVNFEAATDLRKLDFGPLRDPLEPYEPDTHELRPESGFCLDAQRSGNDGRPRWRRLSVQPALDCDRSAKRGEPVHPVQDRVQPDRSGSRGVKWPMYTDDTAVIALARRSGQEDASSRSSTPTCRRPTPSSRW